MQLSGTVHNGVVIFDEGVSLPEGTRVTVNEQDSPTHFDLFRDVIGKAADLPTDMALNHNHYIRGGPKE